VRPPGTGIPPIAGYRRNGSWIEVHHDLQPLASALIVFDPAASSQATGIAPRVQAPQRAVAIGGAGWKLAATGRVPSGEATVIHRDLPMLVDWSLDKELSAFSGRGVYTTHFASPSADPALDLCSTLER
jgi:hypothetical protein